VDQY